MASSRQRKLGSKKQPAELEAHCEYLSAWEEDKWTVAQANVELDEKGRIVPELSNARQAGPKKCFRRDIRRDLPDSRRRIRLRLQRVLHSVLRSCRRCI